MTSTEHSIGLGQEDKTASKILKPPGGGSSDIFGTSAQENSALAAEYKTKNSGNNTSNRIFGLSQNAETPRKVKDYLKSKVFESTESRRVTSNGDSVELEKKNEDSGNATSGDGEINDSTSVNEAKKKGIGNPITGEGYKADDIETEKVVRHPAVRVRNPPGGPSTKLW